MEKIRRRTALRCVCAVCAYRTVSTMVVCILARIAPIDLLVEEQAEVYQTTRKLRTIYAVLYGQSERLA